MPVMFFYEIPCLADVARSNFKHSLIPFRKAPVAFRAANAVDNSAQYVPILEHLDVLAKAGLHLTVPGIFHVMPAPYSRAEYSTAAPEGLICPPIRPSGSRRLSRVSRVIWVDGSSVVVIATAVGAPCRPPHQAVFADAASAPERRFQRGIKQIYLPDHLTLSFHAHYASCRQGCQCVRRPQVRHFTRYSVPRMLLKD